MTDAFHAPKHRHRSAKNSNIPVNIDKLYNIYLGQDNTLKILWDIIYIYTHTMFKISQVEKTLKPLATKPLHTTYTYLFIYFMLKYHNTKSKLK